MEILSHKLLKTFPGPIRSFTVKENHICSAVRKILRYKQKNVLLYIIGLAATPLEASSGTLNVNFFYFKYIIIFYIAFKSVSNSCFRFFFIFLVRVVV